MKLLITMGIILMLISTESNAQKFTAQKGGHCYTLDIPDYMIRTYNLNDVASLQYQNVQREAYTIVIEDSKHHLESLGIKYSDAKDFLEDFVQNYKIEEQNRRQSPIQEFTNNNNKHAQTELEWIDEAGYSFFMLITVAETKTHFYKIMSWTLQEYKERLKYDFQKIAKSLKD